MSNSELTPENLSSGMLLCERYRIERRLDEGGMATIYLAIDETTGLPVAIKVLFSHYSDNTVVQARFLDEGRIQAMLKHPNIVHVYQVVREPLLCFVMEYIEGETLEEYLQRESPLSEREIVELMMPVMSAVGFAHSKGIVHRDLKPSNVLLQKGTDPPAPKIMDFGVAKVSRGKELTADGTTVGTLHYMSPEQIVGARSIDGRADIYSLGCSLYKLCTGEVPFNASSEFALMMAQVEAPPTPPRRLRSDLSKKMQEIILQALAKEPENRFQSIKEMTSELIEVGDTESGRDSVTRPIPSEILQFAMDADEVALDQTDQFRLEYLQGGADTADVDVSGETHELSSSAVREIARDRLKAERRRKKEQESVHDRATVERDAIDDATKRQILDEGTTLPTSESIDEWLPTTRERKVVDLDKTNRDDVAESTEVSPPDIHRSSTSKSAEFSKSKGVVALDDPDIDSREVTNIHISKSSRPVARPNDDEDLRKTVEERGQDRTSGSGSGPVIPTSSSVDEADVTGSTAAERPSLRAMSVASDRSGETVDERPSSSLSALRKNSDDEDALETADERPSARRIAAIRESSSGSGPGDIAVKNGASRQDEARRVTAAGSNGGVTEGHEIDDAQRGGLIWIVIGVVALMLATIVLVWALSL